MVSQYHNTRDFQRSRQKISDPRVFQAEPVLMTSESYRSNDRRTRTYLTAELYCTSLPRSSREKPETRAQGAETKNRASYLLFLFAQYPRVWRDRGFVGTANTVACALNYKRTGPTNRSSDSGHGTKCTRHGGVGSSRFVSLTDRTCRKTRKSNRFFYYYNYYYYQDLTNRFARIRSRSPGFRLGRVK